MVRFSPSLVCVFVSAVEILFIYSVSQLLVLGFFLTLLKVVLVAEEKPFFHPFLYVRDRVLFRVELLLLPLLIPLRPPPTAAAAADG